MRAAFVCHCLKIRQFQKFWVAISATVIILNCMCAVWKHKVWRGRHQRRIETLNLWERFGERLFVSLLLCDGRGSKGITAGAKKQLYVRLWYMCELGIYKEKNPISCAFSPSSRVKFICLCSPIFHSASQWAFRAQNSNGSEPELSRKARRNSPPQNVIT